MNGFKQQTQTYHNHIEIAQYNILNTIYENNNPNALGKCC